MVPGTFTTTAGGSIVIAANGSYTYTLNDAINGNHGVRVALCPTWTACSRSVAFYSDDHSYRPSLVITYLGTAPEPTPPTPEPPAPPPSPGQGCLVALLQILFGFRKP